MKNKLLKLVSLVVAMVSVMSLFSINISAAEKSVATSSICSIPRMNNGADVFNSFYISPEGIAEVACEVIGNDNLTTGIIIEIQLQRKGLLWWSDVDGGYWFNSFDGVYGSMSGGIELEKTGKYRAIFTVTVSGTGGADDVIEETLTYEY